MFTKKYFDSIISFLLLSAILLIALFSYLFYLEKEINKYNTYSSFIAELKLLDKDFDSFTSIKNQFVNYDIIVSKQKRFEILLSKLKDPQYSDILNNTLISQELETIEKLFEKKQVQIEYFKSQNAGILSAMFFIFDVKKEIFNSTDIPFDVKKSIDNIMIDIMQGFSNVHFHYSELIENITLVKQLAQQYPSIFLEYFNDHVTTLTKALNNMQETKQNLKEIKLYDSLLDFENTLETLVHTKHLKTEKFVVLLFLLAALALHLILLFAHLKAKKLKSKLESFSSAIQNSDNSIVITDINKNITFVNKAFEKESGYTLQEVMGKNPRILQSGEMTQETYDELHNSLQNNERWIGEFVNKNSSGEIYYEKASISPIFNEENQLEGYIAVKLNVTDYIKQQQETEFLATHNTLTLLPNRYKFETTINKKIKEYKKKNKQFSLLIVDVDGLKTINDTLGHDYGDNVVKEVAKRLKNFIAKQHTLFHLGGDEFTIITDETSHRIVSQFAKELLSLFDAHITINDHTIKVSASIGIASYPEDAHMYTSLMGCADIALNEVKQHAKNDFAFFSSDLSSAIQELHTIEQALIKALDEKEFYLVYQPKIMANNHKLFSLEALVRWESKTLGFVGPDKFIPIAERMGLMSELGLYIFEAACEGFKTIKVHYPELQKISINVSSKQFKDTHFIHDIQAIIRKTKTDPKNLAIEITETSAMDDIESHIETMQKIRDLGITIMIDDFGTGYSSMSYLTQLPIDVLKIDKSFIDHIPNDSQANSIVKAIISLAKALDYQIVAEGVEDKEQLEFLENNGVDFIQGYYFSRPLKIGEYINKEFKTLD